MASFLSKLFGTKSDRDLKELNPILEEVKAAYEQVKDLDNDGLRAKTLDFKQQIQEATQEEREKISAMNRRLEEEYDMPVREKQKLYEDIEKLEDSQKIGTFASSSKNGGQCVNFLYLYVLLS